jgi:hypothetical protein
MELIGLFHLNILLLSEYINTALGEIMSYLKKLSDLADRFEHTLNKYGQEVSQSGTTELFFGDSGKQQAFATAIQDQGGAVYKALLAAFNKGGGNTLVSFDLKANAEPGQGASWILTVQPSGLKPVVLTALNSIYQGMLGKSMAAVQQAANASAKAGGGSGTNNVGALELAP